MRSRERKSGAETRESVEYVIGYATRLISTLRTTKRAFSAGQISPQTFLSLTRDAISEWELSQESKPARFLASIAWSQRGWESNSRDD